MSIIGGGTKGASNISSEEKTKINMKLVYTLFHVSKSLNIIDSFSHISSAKYRLKKFTEDFNLRDLRLWSFKDFIMVRIEKCSFCGGPIYPGHGTMFVRNDCKCFRFCRKRCRKFWMRKKNPRKFKWTKAYRAAMGKDLVVDSTFDFEQRRNRPVKYDRDLVAATLRTIRLVDEIRQQRENAHWERRMMQSHAIETQAKLVDIQKNVELITRVPEVVKEQTQRAEAEIEQHKQMMIEERREKRRLQREQKKLEQEQQ